MEDLQDVRGLSLRQVKAELGFLNEAIKEGLLEYGDYFTHNGVGAYLSVRREALRARYIELEEQISAFGTDEDKPSVVGLAFQFIYHALALTGFWYFISKALSL